ncbi:hypothetical protein Tco_1484178 [Tanacetum coccineum]
MLSLSPGWGVGVVMRAVDVGMRWGGMGVGWERWGGEGATIDGRFCSKWGRKFFRGCGRCCEGGDEEAVWQITKRRSRDERATLDVLRSTYLLRINNLYIQLKFFFIKSQEYAQKNSLESWGSVLLNLYSDSSIQ